jgi:hypothetical protein
VTWSFTRSTTSRTNASAVDIAELVEAIKVVRRLNRPKSAVRLFFSSFGPVVHWGFIGIGAMAVLMLIISYKDLNKMFPDPGASRVATTEQSRDRKRAEAEAKQRTDEEAEAKAEEDRKRAEAEAKQRADEAARRDPALSVTPGSGEAFQDRLADGEPCPMCPEMVVAPAGTFTMGSPPGERGRDPGEVQVPVTIARPFAVGKYAVIDQWDACAADIVCIAGLRPERPAPTPDYW